MTPDLGGEMDLSFPQAHFSNPWLMDSLQGVAPSMFYTIGIWIGGRQVALAIS